MFVNYSASYQLQTILNPEELSSESNNAPVIKKNSLVYDQIYDFIINQGDIDIAVPSLDKAQFDRFNQLFQESFPVKSRKDGSELRMNLQELMDYLDIEDFEIVGGTVIWILGEEYIRKICTKLHIPDHLLTADFFTEFKRKAADIDLRVLNIKDPELYKKQTCRYLAMKLGVSEQYILDNCLNKYHTHCDEKIKDYFGVISFGDPEETSIDLLFIDRMKRKNLFEHDGPKIEVSRETLPVLKSNSNSILEALILRLTKIVAAVDIENIDTAGACMLFSYLSKGWRYNSPHLENTLTSTFLKSYKFNLLQKLLSNHFPGEPFAPSIVSFNACTLLPKNLILNVSKLLLTQKENDISALYYFHEALLRLNDLDSKSATLYFEGITAYFQIFGFLSQTLIDAKNQEIEINRTTIADVDHFQVRFNSSKKPLHIAVKDDIATGLSNFKSMLKNESLQISLHELTKHFVFLDGELKISEMKSEITAENTAQLSKTAFEFLNAENFGVKQLGFYLACTAGIIENNSTYLATLLATLPVLLKNETDIQIRKNLFYALIKYWLSTSQKETLLNSSTQIESYYKKLDQQHFDEVRFYLTFSEIEIQAVTLIIFNYWNEHPALFGLDSSFELVQNYAKHDLSTAIKLLNSIIEEFDPDYTLFKTYYELVTKRVLLQDILRLSSLTEKLIEKLVSHKKTALQDDLTFCLHAIKKILEVDLEKGIFLVKQLEEKKACTKGFNAVLKLSSDNAKINLALQWNEKFPLDNKTTSDKIHERIELLVECISTESHPELERLGFEIFKAIKLLFASKRPEFAKIKNTVKPKLEWILSQFFKTDDDPKELINLFFKTIESTQPEFSLSDGLIITLMASLKELLVKGEVEYINLILQKLTSRNLGVITDDELEVYHLLVTSAITNQKLEIALNFMKKTLSNKQLKKDRLSDETLNQLDALLNLLQLKNKKAEYLTFLEYFENLFPDENILNEAERCKYLIINLDPSQNLKKLAILTKKSSMYFRDEQAKNIARELITALLVKSSNLNDSDLSEILNLIKNYHLFDASVMRDLKKYLLVKNHLAEMAFTSLRNIGLNLNTLAPFLCPLATSSSKACLPYLQEYENIISQFEEELEFTEKLEFIDDLISSFPHFIKNGLADLITIEKIFLSLTTDVTKKNEMDLKYIQLFNSTDDLEISIKVWEKLNCLSLITNDKKLKSKLLNCAIKSLEICRNNKELGNKLELYLLTFLENIGSKAEYLELPALLEVIQDHPSRRIFDQKINLCIKFLDKLPLKKDNQLTSVCNQFKLSLKKMIEGCFEVNMIDEIHQLNSPKIFTAKEISYYNGKISNALFENIETADSAEDVIHALDHYLVNIESLDECADFAQENMIRAISCLIQLGFNFKDRHAYFSQISKLTKKITGYLDPKHSYMKIDNLAKYYHYELQVKCKNHKEIVFMRQKIYQFFFLLAEIITKKLIENKDNITELTYDIGMSNGIHFSYLLPFKNKDLIISSILKYSYITLVLPPPLCKEFYMNRVGIILEMQHQNYFDLTDSEKQDETSYELHLLNGMREYVPLRLKGINILFPMSQTRKAEILMGIVVKLKNFGGFYSISAAFNFITRYYPMMLAVCPEQTKELFSEIVALQVACPDAPIKYKDTPP